MTPAVRNRSALAALALLPVIAIAGSAPSAPSVALCATHAEAARVAALYAATPAPMTFAAAPQLKLSEAVIASAIPADQAVGTSGASFARIWESLTHWSGAFFLIMKDGNVFEISSTVPTGTPSTKSRFFNLGHEGALSGHLRPDLVSSIYAVQLPTREGFSRGLMFYDHDGVGIFGVFAGGEGREPSPEQLAQFKSTWDLITSLPRACTAPAAANK